MIPTYIYVRVSTDEQMRLGYSLIEQEERLLQYCETNNLHVTAIFREDYSAKDFNRPEWQKLIKTIKRNRNKPPGNIIFLKWDRFSRNIQFAYQMLGILRGLNIEPMAIDQPIDFDIPESIVMLAVYLSIPEAENSRRGKNTSDGMRRAKKMGRWPSRAPIGYTNLTSLEGKKIIVPIQPQANFIKWSFQQLASGLYTIAQVKRMVILDGFNCGRNNFWRIVHNPIYCGLVKLSETKDEELQYIEGIHEPIITKELFEKVQKILKSRRKKNRLKEDLTKVFPLRGFLNCPYCNRKLSGSSSQGRKEKYRYYHCCSNRCKGRFRADALELAYEKQLRDIQINTLANKIFKYVLEDDNVLTTRKVLLQDHKSLLNKLEDEKNFMAKVRRLFIEDKLDHEDFLNLKKEQGEKIGSYHNRLNKLEKEIKTNEINSLQKTAFNGSDILRCYKNQDIEGKRYILSLFSPTSIDPSNRILAPIEVNPAIAPIIIKENNSPVLEFTPIDTFKKSVQYLYRASKSFSTKKVSINRVIDILKPNGIQTNEDQAKVILEFLYLIGSIYCLKEQYLISQP